MTTHHPSTARPDAVAPVRCVVFDLGGVLVRICRSWQEACARAGVAYEPSASERLLATADERHEISHAYERGRIACADFFAGIARSTRGLISPEAFERVHRAWVIEEYPGVCTLIADLRRAGVRTGVLSNTNHSHWEDLRQGVAREVDHPHASHLLGERKPDQAIYRAFERAARCAPADLLFFDDLEDNVAAALRAGWQSVLVDHAADPARQMRRELIARGLLSA